MLKASTMPINVCIMFLSEQWYLMVKYVQCSQVANVIGDAVTKWKTAQLKIEWSLVRASPEALGCFLEQGQCSMFSTSSIDMTERKVLTQTKIITKA